MVGTKIMGILNATPDSFYDGGRYVSTEQAVKHGLKLVEEGADILDIGGESTRPESEGVSLDEERRRVIPLIKLLKEKVTIPLSIDTSKPEIAEEAVAAGASLINDVTGFRDPNMRRVAASVGVNICVMHMLGNPRTMQKNPRYNRGVVPEIISYLEQQVELLIKAGVKEKNIILDPGIGFGKTVADNLEIIHNAHKFKAIGFPVLLGISRKSFISKILDRPPAEVLDGTIAINAFAILASVDFIRVHDVKEHRRLISLLKMD